MRQFEDTPFGPDDYSDVALLVAAVREWPSEEFGRELDSRVARRFVPVASSSDAKTHRRLPRWAAGPTALVVAGAVAAVVVVSGGGLNGSPQKLNGSRASGGILTTVGREEKPTALGKVTANGVATSGKPTPSTLATSHSAPSRAPTAAGSTTGTFAPAQPQAGVNLTAPVPAAPGAKQIQSAQISLNTPNAHVDQVSQEVFDVVGVEHGTVQSSHITAATRGSGGGSAYFTLSFPTSNLQAAMTQLSRLRYAAVSSRTDASQNVSHQYNSDQRHLVDAEALRSSLLKQLQTAYTQTAIDSIKAQLRLAERQITSWQSTLGSLQHQIGNSDVSVQINSGGLPFVPVARSGGFTIHRALHDAGRVLVVSAGVALITLAVLVPVGLLGALLMWLWVWLRQRRREHALDAVQ
jgi:Domain of unknown function (DUF4349)